MPRASSSKKNKLIKKQSNPPIKYVIGCDDWRAHRFDVVMQIPGEIASQGLLHLQLPAWIPGSYMIRDFSKHLESITATEIVSAKSTKSIKPIKLIKIDSHTWELKSKQAVEVRYQVYAFDTSVRAAYLDQERAFFNASSLCLQVLGFNDLSCELELLEPKDLKTNSRWSVQTTLPTKENNQTKQTKQAKQAKQVKKSGFGIYQADSYDTLIDHPVAMGEFQVIEWQAHGTPHRMVIQGLLDAVDARQLSKDLKAICEAHISFFEPEKSHAPFKEYCFMVNAVGDGYGGLEHRNSTALLCKRADLPYPGQNLQKHEAYEDFLGLCSHEYFHSWMVKRVKPKVFDPYVLDQKNHTCLLWLFEGFTSYYDDLQLFRSQRIDLAAYVKRLEKTLNMVLRGPGRHKQSLSESSFDAWTKYYQMDENTPNAVVSYYAKGSLLALALDLKIREHTKQKQSLDDVMRHLWQMYQLTEIGMAEDDFDRAIEFVIGSGFNSVWAQIKRDHIDDVDDFPFETLLPKVGVKVELKKTLATENAEVAKQLLGIRTTANNGWVRLSHVLDGGLAQEAGLSAGDHLASINGERATPGRLEELLLSWIQKLARAQAVKVLVYRHDKELILTMHPAKTKESILASQPKQYTLSV
jgi:predicted metalloprotease with PDZ domain